MKDKEINKDIKLTEICRSFSFRLNTGNYQSVDFFCSRKEECLENEAVKTSERLFAFCKDEVMKDVYSYRLNDLPKDKEREIREKEMATVQVDINHEKE